MPNCDLYSQVINAGEVRLELVTAVFTGKQAFAEILDIHIGYLLLRQWLNALAAFIAGIVDIGAHGIGAHLVYCVGPQQMVNCLELARRILYAGAQPLAEILRRQDQGHAVVQFRHQLIWFGGEDRAAIQFAAIGADPGFP